MCVCMCVCLLVSMCVCARVCAYLLSVSLCPLYFLFSQVKSWKQMLSTQWQNIHLCLPHEKGSGNYPGKENSLLKDYDAFVCQINKTRNRRITIFASSGESSELTIMLGHGYYQISWLPCLFLPIFNGLEFYMYTF